MGCLCVPSRLSFFTTPALINLHPAAPRAPPTAHLPTSTGCNAYFNFLRQIIIDERPSLVAPKVFILPAEKWRYPRNKTIPEMIGKKQWLFSWCFHQRSNQLLAVAVYIRAAFFCSVLLAWSVPTLHCFRASNLPNLAVIIVDRNLVLIIQSRRVFNCSAFKFRLGFFLVLQIRNY